MTTQTKKPGISAAIIVDEGRVLMVRRRVGEGDLLWQFPAGAIEEGEAAEDAAVRETIEETGLVVTAIRQIGYLASHPKSGREMFYTACEPLQGEARVADDEELDAVAWVAHSEIKEYVPYGLYGPVQEYLDEALPH
ncbi:NUDIX domain-containing protein [Streptomyces tuirus]|uniref:NUDIX domain-containing protein n=1 Tax=Streptomyces tuirus TaxID=68278 RepID=A0A941J416_9ACTN|nr:NUDIX domain-containing protein [Streptomyces tuirus]